MITKSSSTRSEFNITRAVRIGTLAVAFVPIIMLLIAGEVSAQQIAGASDRKPCKAARGPEGYLVTSPDCLSESDLTPCRAILEKRFASHIADLQEKINTFSQARNLNLEKANMYQKDLNEVSGMSILEYALKNPPYTPLYDLEWATSSVKDTEKVVAALRSGDENRIRRYYSLFPPYHGRRFETILTHQENNLCMFKLRLAQLQGKQTTKPTVATSPRAPATGTASSYIPGNLTPQQITACSEEIKAKQIESQSWPGNVNDISAKLGRFQKDLFEGRCKGHPEAQAYIAGANKMLSYGGNPNGGTSNSNVAGNVPTGPAEATLQDRPNQQLPSSSNFIRDDGFYERGHGEYRDGILVFNPNPSLLANECMVKFKDIHTGKNGTWRLKNGCNYPVAVASCHNGPHPTNKAYNCQLRTDMGVGVTQPNEIHPVVVERHPHWVACKAPGLPITKWDEGKRKLMGTCTVKSNPDSQWKTFYTH